ncbi:MAG: hypothetical protein JRJ87_15255 [Deltaproteobacteria bacterium]|nr:hypothetical protein [Deltaproteobacteria bacterium]
MAAMELILLLFFFSPEAPYGQPARANKIFQHVPADAMFVITADVASIGQGMNKGLDKLLAAPFIKKSAALQQGAQAIRMGKQMLMNEVDKFGLDPFKDIRYITVCFSVDPEKGERGLIIVGDRIPQKTFEALINMSGAQPKGDLYIIEQGGSSGPQVAARTKNGTVLFGDQQWVEMALAKKHRHKAMQTLLKSHDKKTYLMFAFKLNETIRNEIRDEAEPLLRPLFTSLEGGSVRLTYKGAEIKVLASKKQYVQAWGGILDGSGRMISAYHQAAEGFLIMAEAFLSSLDPVASLGLELGQEEKDVIETLVTQRSAIHKYLITTFLGSKPPVVKTKVNLKAKSATLLLTGRGPGGIALLGGMAGWLMLSRSHQKAPSVIEGPATTKAKE